MFRHMTSVASMLPRAWRFDASTCAFVSDGAAIRVISVRPTEAALLDGAREQVEDLYRDLFELADQPVSRAKRAVARAFKEPKDPKDAELASRTVLAFYDEKPETESDRVAAYSRVFHDGEHVVVASTAVTFELPEDAQQQVLRAITLATEELALELAKDELKLQPDQPVMVQRGQLGASDYLKHLYGRENYSTKLTERIEMTAFLKEMTDLDASIENCRVDGVEIRALNLANDDLVKVYDVLKQAFAPNPPSLEAWKRHYAQQPRFAQDLSFVAWLGDEPISVSVVEYVVNGEGGGEDEVQLVFITDGNLSEDVKAESLTKPLQFPDNYEERRVKIRLTAKTGYVCGVATVPAYRGKKLAQTLLRHNFKAAAHAGLESIFLGTDRENPAAIHAYSRAGMVETKVVDKGLYTAKLISSTP